MILGIDVAGSKKGFHWATLVPNSTEISAVGHCSNVEGVLRVVQSMEPELLVAIDCPPRCQLKGRNTRLAERQLHKQGFRVQWTRRETHEPAEWMENGQALWTALAMVPGATLIETFPTVAVANLATSNVALPLRLLSPYAKQKEWNDFVDACICAEVGDRFLRGKAESVGYDPETGEEDELGRIWF